MNHGVNSTTMEDLDDNMLTQILIRLPSCATALACTPVNKRWGSLIFDPNFPDQFVNHKKKIAALLKGSGFSHGDEEPPWCFITAFTEFIFGSPKLSLEFLPDGNSCTTSATFKDLVLCVDRATNQVGGRVYYITNPFTKQWVALPPRPYPWKPIKSTALMCQQPSYKCTQDYKFRVVEVCHPCMDSQDAFDLFVYCSEIGEWKEIKLRVPKEAVELLRRSKSEHKNIVCNGIIYFKIGLCLLALDPFDVNDTSDTTIEVRVMPSLPDFGYLLESSGQLLVVDTPGGCCLWHNEVGMTLELGIVVWKLDPNQAPLVWEKTFEGLCKGTEFPHYTRLKVGDIGIHPYNDKLIYMYLAFGKQLILCNTRTGCITPSKSLPNNLKLGFHRLEQQWWPTSVPSLVQRVAVEQNLPPLQLKSRDDSC